MIIGICIVGSIILFAGLGLIIVDTIRNIKVSKAQEEKRQVFIDEVVAYFTNDADSLVSLDGICPNYAVDALLAKGYYIMDIISEDNARCLIVNPTQSNLKHAAGKLEKLFQIKESKK